MILLDQMLVAQLAGGRCRSSSRSLSMAEPLGKLELRSRSTFAARNWVQRLCWELKYVSKGAGVLKSGCRVSSLSCRIGGLEAGAEIRLLALRFALSPAPNVIEQKFTYSITPQSAMLLPYSYRHPETSYPSIPEPFTPLLHLPREIQDLPI